MKSDWPDEIRLLANSLHEGLSLNDKNWHQLKSNHKRRGAELISAAIVQLIAGGKPSDIEALLSQSVRWLKHEINDPGCPNH